MFNFDDATIKGREVFDGVVKSYSEVAKSAQAIALEAAEFSRASYEQGIAHAEAVSGVKSPEAFFELQASYMRTAYESAVAEMTRIGAMYVDLGKAAYKPFEAPLAKPGPVARAKQAATEVVDAAQKAINAA